MPRRKKKRTQKGGGGDQGEEGAEKTKVPKTFVFKRGKVGFLVQNLVENMVTCNIVFGISYRLHRSRGSCGEIDDSGVIP